MIFSKNFLVSYFSIGVMVVGSFIPGTSRAQQKTTPNRITLPASSQYHKSKNYQFWWGKHYRKEWHQPVSFPIAHLDSLFGGLTPYQLGGGSQTSSLKLRDKQNREYVLSCVDKPLSSSLPSITNNSFVEDVANDQITFTHPYAALVVAPLAQAAGIFHSNPKIYFVPHQPALKQFNHSLPEALYMLEERGDGDWHTAPNFGFSENIVGSEKMLSELLEDNDHRVNQLSFAKARLFDMMIGDWGRHDDQWRWAEFKHDGSLTYEPVPRDRDNAFTKMDGALVKLILSVADAEHMQDFTHHIKQVSKLNFTARHLDRNLLNELTKDDWLLAAQYLQTKLTDSVIINAVKEMPAEVYPFHGNSITAKIMSRRNFLKEYAAEYYQFLAKQVAITGSEENEIFEIVSTDNHSTLINIYASTPAGAKKDLPFYSRVFLSKETNEIRLFGIGGSDKYVITGPGKKNIKIRLIGGAGTDEYLDHNSRKKAGSKTIIYDDKNNHISKNQTTKLHITPTAKVPIYDYENFEYDKSGIDYIAWYNNEDRFHVGLGYKRTLQGWGKKPYRKKEEIALAYSLPQRAFSATYQADYINLINNWDVNIFGVYDQMRWTNFYGLGNNSVLSSSNKDYFRARSRVYEISVGISQKINDYQRLGLKPFFKSYDFVRDTARFLSKQTALMDADFYNSKNYLGITAFHLYQKLNDSILPTKGIQLSHQISFSKNVNNSKKEMVNLQSKITLYTPIGRYFSLKNSLGASHVFGQPEFFQLNTLGGGHTLRGFNRDRFYGNSAAYLQNNIRFITAVNAYYYKGKIGVFGLFDVGRVWVKDEVSNYLPYSYGAGILLSPFNKFTVTASIAFSNEGTNNIHFNYIRPL